MTDRVFFYGTLMTGFNRRLRIGVDSKLRYVGRGSIKAILFDLGIYPAAVPGEGRVWGELFETNEPELVLAGLDSIEGYRPGDPEHSLYTRVQSSVTLEDGRTLQAWVYFYNAPLGQAAQILSGDYLQYLDKSKHK
jgi:gamma-glutamylcyclotransferase (GGCT)/AIG2-like uncharacterized protein YtfP